MSVYRRLLLGLGAFTSLAYPAVAAKGEAGDEPGAAVPWICYEAEQAATNGKLLGPDYTGQIAAREASGRQCVVLASAGDYLQFKATADAQGTVVRYSIPDLANGRSNNATLSLSINGKFRANLALTSKYSHVYGGYPFSNDPVFGTPRNFWDDVRAMPGQIHAGDLVRIEKSADDGAAACLIDFVDLEPVAAPLARPANALDVTDFGATPNDTTDDRPAFAAAIAAAVAQKTPVWIPAGRFVVAGSLDVKDVALLGAGVWYSTLVGSDDYAPGRRVTINGTGSNITLADFSIIGKLDYRNDAEPNDGIGGSFGTGSALRNLWIEHTKTGAWLTNADGLTVEGCRFRNTLADGINLCVGMHNTIVRNCSARNTGDDCFAMWPAAYTKSTCAHGGNRFVHCTAQLPFLAQAFAIYGGDGNAVEDCSAIDIPYGAGLYASTAFPTEFGFRGTTTFARDRLVRTGAGDGAIGIVANRIDLVGVRFEDIDVISSATDGIRFSSMNQHALRDATFDRIRVVDPGMSGQGHGVAEAVGAVGSAVLNDVSILNPRTTGWQDDAPAFKLIRGRRVIGLENGKVSSTTNLARPSADDH